MIIKQTLEIIETAIVPFQEEIAKEDFIEWISAKRADLVLVTSEPQEIDYKNGEFPVKLWLANMPKEVLQEYRAGQKFNVKIEITPIESENNE
jgi:hypothetical protein